MALVPLKRKRDRSAELKTDPAKRAYMRIPDEAKLWFQDFHAYQARVHGKSLAYNTRRAKHLVPELFGPVAPDTFRRWHDGGARDLAADRLWSCHRSPFRVLRTSPMPSQPGSVSASPLGSTSTAVCCASSTSNWSPKRNGRGSFFAACSSHGSSGRLAPASRPSEADIARERKLLQLRVIYLCHRFKISQDRIWNLDETAVHCPIRRAWVRVSLCLRLARLRHGHARCEHEERARGRRSSMRRKATEYILTGQRSPCQLVSHSPTHWITQETLLNMIDATDVAMHARAGDAEHTPWLLAPRLCATARC